MEDIMKILDNAFRTICHISVREGDVELMAAAKQALRDAYARLDSMRKEETNGQAD